MATKKFRCKVCGYVHEGDAAPAACPVCNAPASEFEEITEKKKLFNTNSNAYTLIYATVIVVIVALLLSVTSAVLKERQQANIELDKKKQILTSLNVDVKSGNPSELYDEYILTDMIVDADGEVLQSEGGFDKGSESLVVYIASVNGEAKYIFPLNGMGLWGAIWGYIALDDDKDTVYGVYFSHASETPGLGAEIATENFQKRFVGKHIKRNGKFTSIQVVKPGHISETSDSVDGISGGTITSTAVSNMLSSVLGKYEQFLNK